MDGGEDMVDDAGDELIEHEEPSARQTVQRDIYREASLAVGIFVRLHSVDVLRMRRRRFRAKHGFKMPAPKDVV